MWSVYGEHSAHQEPENEKMTTNNDNKDNTINVATVAAIAPAPAPSLDETPRYRGAFARMLVAIRALTSDRYVPVNLDVMSSVRTTEGVLPKIASYREVIAQQLPQFDIRLFDELEDRALALGHAHTVFEGTQQAPPLSPELVEEASHLYDVGHSEVTTMVHRKLIAPQALSSLNGGNGYRNLAADLFKLSESLRSNWGKISGRTSMTLAELARPRQSHPYHPPLNATALPVADRPASTEPIPTA